MKTKTEFIFLLIGISFGCTKLEYDPKVISGRTSGKIFDQSSFYSNLNTDSIALTTLPGFYKIGKGNKQVFEWIFEHPDDPAIADEELTEYIVFQKLPDKAGTFTLDVNQLNKENFYYKNLCYCIRSVDQKIVKGKISGTWYNGSSCKIDADISIRLYYANANNTLDSSTKDVKIQEWFYKQPNN